MEVSQASRREGTAAGHKLNEVLVMCKKLVVCVCVCVCEIRDNDKFDIRQNHYLFKH